ncbi:hypothetical protein BASA81_017751 [Batrachochytrium salamandrivorans]|nr:hypothetical protein BASA81_017751 [Batrachochytrium salamandrivorans]
MNSYALQLQQSHQLALVAQIYACSPYAQLDQYFGYWRQPPATYPVVGYPSQWSLQNNGVFSATPQSDFFENTQAYPYLSDSEKRRIALGNTFNSKEGLQISQLIRRKTKILLPEMIRIPISGNEESADDNGSQAACEQEEEAAIPAIEEDKEDQKSPPQVDMCFASVAEIEAQSSEVVEVVEAVEAATVQHHQSVHCTGDLVQALKTVSVPAIRQKSGLVKDKTILVHTTAPKRSQSNRTQKPLAPKHKLAIKIAPSTSTEQVTLPHAWEAALPTALKRNGSM